MTAIDERIENQEVLLERRLLNWINSFPELPEELAENGILYGGLRGAAPEMALGFPQEETVKSRDITGGYKAECRFTITYRIRPGDSTDRRLQAEELLSRMGAWAQGERPALGTGIRVRRIEPVTRATLVKVYDNGEEEHQIILKITYEGV